ncbi:uncharacterized protein N7458_000262 [Penicillium daleae]|uniref:Uncharacterized protein n=1 Tax=Penicillium daleae TaxID=63821 RepID=A0AAD6G8M2_9EURO|nr:uncharacterized protein N7458_000262 [Penicillium daleae]KAJ5464576.1 hypothetical protein N7458_000262 [Penicillium daleae]
MAIRTAVATRHISINQSIVEDRQMVLERLATALFRDNVLEIDDPATATTSGRPRGRANHPRKNPKAATEETTKNATSKKAPSKKATAKTSTKTTQLSRSTRQYPSRFETVAKRTARIGREGRGG